MTATSEVVGVRPAGISAWLSELGIAHFEPLRFTRLGIGQSNLTYLVSDAAGAKWVLRRPPLGHLLASAHDVAREGSIMSALAATPVPAPAIYGLTEDPALTDVPMLLMEYVEGRVIDQIPVAQSLTPAERRDIGLALPATLAQIHSVDLAAVGLEKLASHKPYAQRQLKRWAGQWELAKTREVPEVDDLTQRLVAGAPPQHEVTLVHGDFHLRNLITSSTGGQIVAVLDWELATLGEPLADVGSMLAYWVQPGDTALQAFAVTALDGFPDRAELAQAYLRTTGRDEAALEYWHALALWKIAIIATGVLRRAIDEPDNEPEGGAPTPEVIDSLISLARETADRAGI